MRSFTRTHQTNCQVVFEVCNFHISRYTYTIHSLTSLRLFVRGLLVQTSYEFGDVITDVMGNTYRGVFKLAIVVVDDCY